MKALSLLGFAQAAGQVVSGYNGCLAVLRQGRCHLVVLAGDAGPATREKFLKAAKQTPIVTIKTKDELGNAIGKSSRAVLCVQEKKIAQAIIDAVNTTLMEAEGAHGKIVET
ncbi:MAG: 50S ribosomal protein L7ae [Firmicutes bacterium]|nr:50S ribosomal protein L7ae [Bacillota bacterium]